MKTKLLLLLTCITCFNVFAQIGFNEHIITDNSNQTPNAQKVENFDFDGDGDLDFISHSFDLYWYENIDGQGEIGNKNIIYDGLPVRNFFSSDLDNDGDIDFVISFMQVAAIAWLKNDGLGNFEYNLIEDLPDYSVFKSIYCDDIDNDGYIDIVISPYPNSTKVLWFKNLDGLGNFSTLTEISISNNVTAVLLTDFDNDGDKDLLLAGATGQILWYKNLDGLGNFVLEQSITTNSSKQLHVADVDNDGDNDILSVYSGNTTYYTGKLVWFENTDGLGNFSDEIIIADANISGARVVTSGDIDGDGDLDVVLGASNTYSDHTSKIIWYENVDGMGNFVEQQVTNTNESTFDLTSISTNDIDNDGYLDIVSSSSGESRISWHKNMDGLGTFGSQNIIGSTASGANSIVSSDIDGDNDLDIISGTVGDKKVVWYENINGEINKQPNAISLILARSDFVYSEDMDGDGDMDVVSKSDARIVWYENLDGLGTFNNEIIIDDTGGSSHHHTNDIDGDGDIDVVAGYFNNKLVWFENDGVGNFSNELVISINVDRVLSTYSIDIDGDGDLDVLCATEQTDKIAWFENTDGLGDFGSINIIATNVDRASSINGADIDNDGDIDILITSYEDGIIRWYENTNSLGSFGPEQIISENNGAVATVYTKDLDNDGDQDVISSSDNENKLVWYENTDGFGNFGVEQIISTNLNDVTSIDLSDMDNDGDFDVLLASYSDSKLAWYENVGIVSNEINGFVHIDTSLDGCSTSNTTASNIMLVTDDGVNTISTYLQSNGFYQFFTGIGNFTTQITSNLPNYYVSNPTMYSSNFTDIGNTDTANFCLEPTVTINDLNISIYPSIDDPRPGFDTSYQLVYNNVGTTQLSGNVTFEFDDTKLSFLNASETIASQTSNTITFDFADLNPFETRTIDLEFNVFAPPTTEIGDILNATATVNPISGDNTEEDNVFTLEQIVIGSYDPNDIRVLEGDEILLADADKYLHYIIRFQNTGTASAINVRVENILDDKLDWTTMQLESLSHTGRVEIKDGSEVSFIFDNINLPDSTSDEPNSHGFIAYKIKPKSDVVVGDVFYNTVDIFFDFNPAITTNTVATEIVENLSTEEFIAKTISIYPNPTENQIIIKSKIGIDGISVFDINGRILNSEMPKNAPLEFKMDVSNLSNGLYFLEILSGNAKQTKKFIKK